MVGSHKILTVSYGTFSCTLEGFDDAFGTMKAIAEYFRDLAADDRYFGATPPTPDPEMLARIAEREIARRVEARMGTSGLVLRAAGPLGESDPPRPPAEAGLPPDPVEPAGATARSPTLSEDRPAAGAVPPSPMPPPAGEDGLATRLDRIRAVVGRAGRDDGEGATAQPAIATARDPALSPDRDARPAAGGSGTAAAVAEPPEETGKTMAADQPHRPRVLRLRRAALEQALAAAGTAGAARPEDRETDVPASVMPDPGDETGRALGTASTGEPPAGDQTADDATPQGEAAPASGLSPEAEAALQAELAALEAELAMVDPGSSAPEASASEPPEAEAVPASEQRGDDPALLWTDEPDMAEEGGRPRAVENLFAADADTVIEGTVIARDDAGNDGQPGPQDDAQAEAREPTGAAAAASPAGAEAEPPSEAIPLRPVSAHPILGRTPEADEAALSRIISRTDAVLADPEAQRRREAIAQLKAAVAATEAARRLGETDPSGRAENRQDAFRDDLRQVVHPRRPLPAAAARGERPRPAPLKLVASQRVDLTEEAKPAPARQPRPAPVQPVRPRRVMLDRITAEAAAAASSAPSARTAPPARAATAARTTGSFAAFAAEMGATSLTDILEAAAVYTSVVEGAEDFSRPQILDKLHEASPHPVSREDGLRSFGILLRTGRIMRVRGGRFAVAGDSRFHPDRRAG